MLTIVRESENWTPLPKMADSNTSLRDDPYPSVTHNILKLLLVWDLIELSCNTMTISERLAPDNVEYFQENVWQRSRLIPDVSLGRDDPFEDHEYVRRMRNGSIYNLVFGHRVVKGRICFNSVLTTSQVDSSKLLSNDEKLRRDVKFPHYVDNIIRRHTKEALRCLYTHFGVDKDLGKYVWNWDWGIHTFEYRKTSSAGVRPGQDHVYRSGDVKYVYTVGGSKGLQLPFMCKVMDDAIKEFYLTGELKLPQVINAVGLKKEFLYTAEENDDAALKMQDKIRYIWL